MQRYIFAFNAAWIAAAVEGLVMGLYRLSHPFNFWDRPQYLRTHHRMRLHHRKFVVGKRTSFVKNSVGNEKFADVMHPPREDDVLYLLRREIQPTRDDPGVVPAL